MSGPRQVRIERVGDSWAVAYVQRRKHQRHWAACFYAPDHTREAVEEWVERNPKLELEKPESWLAIRRRLYDLNGSELL